MGFFGGRSTTTRAEKLDAFQINSASFGEVVPEVLGTTRMSGNIIYYDDFTAHEHRETQRAGKGGKSKHTNITYTYTVACCIGLCEGPIQGIGKVWRDKDILRYPSDEVQMTLFDGRKGQEPWPYVTSKHPEKALPYSGLAYMAGVIDLGTSASLPTLNFEVQGKLLETGDGIDVNPADYIVHILKSVGIEETSIVGLEHYRLYCKEADILISTPPDDRAHKAQQIISDIAEMTNAYLFWSDDKLKIVPLADKPIGNWSPRTAIQYELTNDDFLPMNDGRTIEYNRKTSSECYNQATVEFINRANSYEKETVSYDILADIQKNGLKPAPNKQAHYLYTKKRALFFAEQLAMKRLYERNQYKFKLDWAFCRLEPGDIVTITESTCGVHRQIVVITEVNEDVDGTLSITAVGKPPGVYAPVQQNVHENERPFVDFNVKAKPITDMTFIQPPVDLTETGRELWIALSAPSDWGGANIWVSDSGDAYKNEGLAPRTARVGKLVMPLSKTDTSCRVRMVNGDLKPGTHIDAERANTVCWINGECLSYEGATLNTDGTVTLSGLIRGQYATPPMAHGINDKIVRLDESVLRKPYKESDVGKRIYVKATSFNPYGAQEEDISTVKAYEYTIRKKYIPNVSNLALSTVYRNLGGKAFSYDLVVTFEPPDIEAYDTAEVWYREGVKDWILGGMGANRCVISQCELGKTYEVKVIAKDLHGNISQGITSSKLIEIKSDTPNMPTGFSVRFSDVAIFNWLEVTNADVDFYEIRTTPDPGLVLGMLGRSTNTTFSSALQSREGTVYLYAHNPIKGYSTPAILSYNRPKIIAPENVEVKPMLQGLSIRFDVLPTEAIFANVYVDEKQYQTRDNILFVPVTEGTYRVKVAYVDLFGEGEMSNDVLATVDATIPTELLDLESLGLNDMDKAIKEVKNTVGNLNTTVTQAVSNSITGIESRLTQLSNGIDLRISDAVNNLDGSQIISRINLSKAGTRIDGNLLHVTGKALFDDNIITSKMLQANAVSAEKMKVDTLSSITAKIGTLRTKENGARVEIKDNLIEIYNDNNKLVVRMGVWDEP